MKMALDGDGILRVAVHDGVNDGLITQIDVQREGAHDVISRSPRPPPPSMTWW